MNPARIKTMGDVHRRRVAVFLALALTARVDRDLVRWKSLDTGGGRGTEEGAEGGGAKNSSSDLVAATCPRRYAGSLPPETVSNVV